MAELCMFGRLIVVGIVIGGMSAIAVAAMGYQAVDLSTNYKLVPANITSVDTECYIEKNSKSRVVDKATSKLAYFDCFEARSIATSMQFSEADIHTKSQVNYDFLSPADGQSHEGKFERKDIAVDIAPGKQISVYAHLNNPNESRTTKSNLFLTDTGV
jgi:hypothetical protein